MENIFNINTIILSDNNSNNNEFIRIIMEHLNNNTDNDILDQSFNEQNVSNKPCSQNFIDELEDLEIIQEDIDMGLSCAICQESFKLGDTVIGLPCEPHMHYFHKFNDTCPGIFPWLKEKNTCPICRSEFPVEEIPENEEISENEEGDVNELDNIIYEGEIIFPNLNNLLNQPPPNLIIQPSEIIDNQEELINNIPFQMPLPDINSGENIHNIEENIIQMLNAINSYSVDMNIDDSGFPLDDINEAIRRSIN